jgi:hypothetical protein
MNENEKIMVDNILILRGRNGEQISLNFGKIALVKRSEITESEKQLKKMQDLID